MSEGHGQERPDAPGSGYAPPPKGLLARLIDALELPVCYVDSEQRYQYCARAYQELVGRPDQNLLGRRIRDVLGEPAYSKLKHRVEEALSGKRTSFDVRLPFSQGTAGDREATYVPHQGPGGSVEGFFAHVQDVTELRQAEADRTRTHEELQASESRQQDLYDNAPDMYVSGDPETGEIKECNQTLATALGYTKEDIIGRPIFEMYHPDCMEDVQKAFHSFVTTGEVHDAELQLRRKDGNKIDVSLNVSAVRDKDGRILYSRSAWRDMTARKKTEHALRESEERFRAVIRAATDAIVGGNDEGEIVFFNPAAEATFGYQRDDILGKPIWHLMPEQYRDAHKKGLERYRLTGQAHVIGKTVELEGRRKDGTEFPLELSLSTWETPEGRFYTGIIRDITERKKNEEEQARSTAELERFNRLAVGREQRMIELKREVNELLEEAGKLPAYDLSFVPES